MNLNEHVNLFYPFEDKAISFSFLIYKECYHQFSFFFSASINMISNNYKVICFNEKNCFDKE
jgi:hypothetical protein